jgi:hypothetical protein
MACERVSDTVESCAIRVDTLRDARALPDDLLGAIAQDAWFRLTSEAALAMTTVSLA